MPTIYIYIYYFPDELQVDVYDIRRISDGNFICKHAIRVRFESDSTNPRLRISTR